jgi:hypothetical protein
MKVSGKEIISMEKAFLDIEMGVLTMVSIRTTGDSGKAHMEMKMVISTMVNGVLA